MAWSWSHTAQAYEDAEANCSALPVETLLEIAAEWQAVKPENSDADYEGFSLRAYNVALEDWQNTDAEILASYVWQRAEEQRTCTNGGWLAWLCPFGCDSHCVPFDRQKGN